VNSILTQSRSLFDKVVIQQEEPESPRWRTTRTYRPRTLLNLLSSTAKMVLAGAVITCLDWEGDLWKKRSDADGIISSVARTAR
jgi:hypothetical protein